MPLKFIGLLIMLGGLAIVTAGTWYRHRHPAVITPGATIRVSDSRTGDTLILKTRLVSNGSIQRTEVELPAGTWIDCAGDCKDAVRHALTEFWDDRNMRR